MNVAMISIAPDVLTRLLALRSSDSESFSDVLRRVLTEGADASAGLDPAKVSTAPALGASSSGVRYLLNGGAHTASDATEAMINILRDLARDDDNFLQTLAARVRGRTRNHLARSSSDVYPDRPDLAQYVKQVSPGWFIGCNIANREKDKILRAACKVAGLTFGRDLKIGLPHA